MERAFKSLPNDIVINVIEDENGTKEIVNKRVLFRIPAMISVKKSSR